MHIPHFFEATWFMPQRSGSSGLNPQNCLKVAFFMFLVCFTKNNNSEPKMYDYGGSETFTSSL